MMKYFLKPVMGIIITIVLIIVVIFCVIITQLWHLKFFSYEDWKDLFYRSQLFEVLTPAFKTAELDFINNKEKHRINRNWNHNVIYYQNWIRWGFGKGEKMDYSKYLQIQCTKEEYINRNATPPF